jgi:hypothetical protein
MDEVEQHIRDLVSEIVRHASSDDDQTIANALRLTELRRLIIGGAAGHNTKWMEWAVNNIGLSPSRLYELLSIADAKDPKAKLEQIRRLNREKQKRYLGGRASTDPERRAVIKLIKVIELDSVRKIRKYVDSLMGQ